MPDFSLVLPHAYEFRRPNAVFRDLPTDFQVTEELGFELTGEGEHLWVLVEKTGLNTQDVIKLLSEISGVPRREIGYAGLKDRQAVARQWFSLKTTGDLALEKSADNKVQLLEQVRNSRKLRQGSHKGNRFSITLRDVDCPEDYTRSFCNQVLAKGVPNYFGLQRFGNHGNNLEKAQALFSGTMKNASHFQRGIYLSAARAFLFNKVLAHRVSTNTWDSYLSGDMMMLAGTSSHFAAQADDNAIPERLSQLDIHPTGPLWGNGELPVGDLVQTLEAEIVAEYPDMTGGLEAAGLKQERRALRLVPDNLAISSTGERQLVVEFSLPKGAYATSVLREMVEAPGL